MFTHYVWNQVENERGQLEGAMKESHKFVSRFSDFLLDDRKKISDILSGHLFSRTFEGSRFFRPQKGNSQLFFTHFGKQTLFETTIFFFLTFEVADANDDAVASGKKHLCDL